MVDATRLLAQRRARREAEPKGLDAKNRRIVTHTEQRHAPPPRSGKLIVAVDPGGSTGIAVRYPNGNLLTVTATKPSELFEFFIEKPDICVLETFSTGGRVDRHMIYTIELVGGVKAACFVLGIRCILHVPQRRNAWIEQAAALLRGTPHTRHEIDAAAHLLAFEETQA